MNLFGFLEIRFADLLDILLVSLFFYYLFLLFRGSRAQHMAIGLIILSGFYFLAVWWGLRGVQWLFSHLFTVGVVAIVILFQPEIRGAFSRIGQNASRFTWRQILFYGDPEELLIDALVEATWRMAQKKQGALIAIERKVGLKTYIDTGVEVNADVMPELLDNIFYPKSPLHDGAVIISEGKIKAAACTLPVFTQKLVERASGMRHRAAETLAHESDAVLIVVSEETGEISLMSRSKIASALTPDEMEVQLKYWLNQNE